MPEHQYTSEVWVRDNTRDRHRYKEDHFDIPLPPAATATHHQERPYYHYSPPSPPPSSSRTHPHRRHDRHEDERIQHTIGQQHEEERIQYLLEHQHEKKRIQYLFEHQHEKERIPHKHLAQAKERMQFETERYPPRIREYIRSYTRDAAVLERTATTLFRLDVDSDYLASQSTALLEKLGSVDELKMETAATAEESDNDEYGYEEEEEEEEEDVHEDDFDDIEDDYDDIEAESQSAYVQEYRRRPRVLQPEVDIRGLPARTGGSEPPPPTTPSNGFMRWSNFKGYALTRTPDIVGDRRKSIIALAQEVEFGVPTPIGPVTMKGFLGLLAVVLKPRDLRAYYKAAERVILLPMPVLSRPTVRALAELEQSLLGTSKFIGDGRLMTCLTYSRADYGTITLFEVELQETRKGGGGEWPKSIRPVAAMANVPKKLLKKTAKAVHRSHKTRLEVHTKASKTENILGWASLASGSSEPTLRNSANVRRSTMPANIREALAIDSQSLMLDEQGTRANLVCATIPEMLAWLHVKASYLTGVDIEGTEFRRGGPIKGVVRWKQGPAMIDHEGENPRIVVLHPAGADWITRQVYWTGPRD